MLQDNKESTQAADAPVLSLSVLDKVLAINKKIEQSLENLQGSGIKDDHLLLVLDCLSEKAQIVNLLTGAGYDNLMRDNYEILVVAYEKAIADFLHRMEAIGSQPPQVLHDFELLGVKYEVAPPDLLTPYRLDFIGKIIQANDPDQSNYAHIAQTLALICYTEAEISESLPILETEKFKNDYTNKLANEYAARYQLFYEKLPIEIVFAINSTFMQAREHFIKSRIDSLTPNDAVRHYANQYAGASTKALSDNFSFEQQVISVAKHLGIDFNGVQHGIRANDFYDYLSHITAINNSEAEAARLRETEIQKKQNKK